MKELPLTQGKVALVDDSDFEFLSQFKWRYRLEGRPGKSRIGRAIRTIQRPGTTDKYNRINLYLHRQIMDAQPGQIVDHKNGDGLDNRRENLRFATPTENVRNSRKPKFKNLSSKYKGVYYYGAGKHFRGTRGLIWGSRIKVNKQNIFLGRFATELEAHTAYCEAAQKYFGEFARTG